MNELHALFQHLLAHLCSGGGIVLLLVLAVAGLLVFCRRIFGRGFLAALFLLPVTFVAVQTGALKPPQSGPDTVHGVLCCDSPLVLPDPVGPVSTDVSSVSAPVLCLTEQTVLSNRVGLAAAWSPDAPVDILASFRSPTLAPPDWRIEDVFTGFIGPTNHAWSVARDPAPPLANDWANGEAPIQGWTYLGRSCWPEPGLVVAHPAALGSGHVGVVDYDGEGIAAGTEKVSRWYDFLDGTSGFNQYTGDE